ncbi:hypothetical protein Glove_79g32 [Diversispora epigaea]|uniref:Protein kinase domain-containing protein n=1 Tax=Diversispora epigaea TaxID=1348612 RepID=A0A397J8E0_9GLOM|nr:hypothetical protein Glove_79g32 [Diversispora epigaea]
MNSENILIHNNIIKISNFGISKLVIEPSILLNSLGLIEYSDPILLKAEGKFRDESRLKDKFSSKNGCRSKIDCWIQDTEQRPNIEKVIQELEHVAKKIDDLNTHPL